MKIRSWDDVDFALGTIRESNRIIGEAKGKVDQERKTIAELEPRIEAFVREHEDELQERSKSLAHGRVWLRQATRLVARSWGKVLDRLKGASADWAIRTKQEPDKEALAQASDEVLARYGVARKTEDAFGYETT